MKYKVLIILITISLSTYGQKVLFVGNSLSYSNNMPELLESIGKEFNKKIEADCLCFPNYGLEDHWNDGLFQKKLKTDKFDYVIFQQGPSSQAYGRSSLQEFGGKISKLAEDTGAIPAYFMVWPSVRYYHTFKGVIKNHTDAAIANDASLIKVGTLWESYRANLNSTDLYASDHFHPSKAGSFFTSLIIFQFLYPEQKLKAISYSNFKEYFSKKDALKEMVRFINDN